MLGMLHDLCISVLIIYSLLACRLLLLGNIYVLSNPWPHSLTRTAISLVLCPLIVLLGLILTFLGEDRIKDAVSLSE